ncbi:MAG TPA: ABC transporter ATP-binding protein, partial [Candidatus Nanoarchaeia archaeon]|nr:ABC transporter ATP-binding protein [Candidatus Nanoarchaeia archaeon]
MKPSRAAEGSLKDFYQIVSFLLPDFGKFIMNRSLVSLFYESLKLVPVYLVKLIIDHILLPSPEFSKLVMLIGFVLLSLILLTAIEVGSFGYAHRILGSFQRELLEKVHRKLMHLPLSFHERQNTGAVVSKVNKAANYIGEMIWFINNDIVPTIFQIVLTSALLVITTWQVGVIYLVSLPIILHMVISTNKITQPYRRAYHHSFEHATGELAQSLYNVKTVKDYTQEQREHDSYSKTLKEYAKQLVKRWDIEAWRITWKEIFTNTVRAITMVLAVWFVLHGSLTPGDLVLIFTLTEKAFINIHRLGRVYNFLGDAHESLSRARRILTEKNFIESPGIPKDVRNKTGTILFKNVNFSYGSEDILIKINLCIPAKKVIAVIGESGSGKSTLVKLITRHYDVTSGQIMLDNIDLREMA